MERWLGKICRASFGVKEFVRGFNIRIFKVDMLLKIVWFESSESLRGELEKKLGRGEEGRRSEMWKEWRWRFDGMERERLRDPMCRLFVG